MAKPKIREPKEALQLGVLCDISMNGNPINHGDGCDTSSIIRWRLTHINPNDIMLSTTTPQNMTMTLLWSDIECVWEVSEQVFEVNVDY